MLPQYQYGSIQVKGRFYGIGNSSTFLIRNKNNICKFTQEDLEGVRIVLCLRDTGMPLADIKKYMELIKNGMKDDCNPLEH